MRYLLLVFIFFLFSCTNISSEQQEIITAFNNTNNALLNRNGQVIYDNVTTQTHDYYSNIFDLAKNKKIQGPIDQKMNVLSALAFFSDDELKAMSDKDFFIQMYNNADEDPSKADAINAMVLQNIKINKDTAVATLPGNVEVKFYKQNGKWKYDYLVFINVMTPMIESFLIENNMTESQFLKEIVLEPTFVKRSNKSTDELLNYLNGSK